MAEALLSVTPERARELDMQVKLDAWYNQTTGYGTTKDKTTYGAYGGFYPIAQQTLSDLYHGDAMAARMVDVVPQEMLREGFSVDADDPDTNIWLANKLRDLDARAKVQEGERWGGLFGGAALLVGADDGRPASMPLIPERAKSVSYIYVLDRRMLWPFSYYDQPGHPKLGQPETYLVTATNSIAGIQQVVHESRLIVFRGAPTGLRERVQMNGWDFSILQRPYEVLRQYNVGWNSLELMMTDGNQAVFTMSGLADIIAAGGMSALQTRMAAISLFRSNLNAMVVDAGDAANGGEKFERQQLSYEGIPQALDKLMLRLASAVQIPVTILMGQSPAGMSATGDSDFRWFYDRIRAKQTNELAPKIRQLVKIILATKESPRKDPNASVNVNFPSLWKETPKDEAARRLANAQADSAYVTAGVLLPEEVALARFGVDGYGDDIRLNDEAKQAREDGLVIELDDIATKPEPEPPVVVAPVDGSSSPVDDAAKPRLDARDIGEAFARGVDIRFDGWEEQDRADNGQFGSGGGGGSGSGGAAGGVPLKVKFSPGASNDDRPSMASTPKWTKTDKGYTIDHDTHLVKNGKNWELHHKGQVVSLGKKASFDHAEGALAALRGK